MNHPIVLFDGVCKFCDASVNFIIDHDPRKQFRLASLQSPAGEALLHQFGLRTGRLDSMVLIENRRAYTRSTAAVRIARRLSGLWPVASLLIVVPAFLRDAVYNVIARNRYRWFGQMNACRMPTPDMRERFLD